MSNRSVKAPAEVEMLTVTETAVYLRVHPSTIYRLLKREALPAFKVGRDWRFDRSRIASAPGLPR
jgi:excisionase family DNA binding protein